MNNAFLIEEDEPKDVSHIDTEKMESLTEIIEALQHIGGSKYWKVLQNNVFNVNLEQAKRSLAKEKDTVEMFRYQGEIRVGERYNLESLITKYRNQLQTIKKKQNG